MPTPHFDPDWLPTGPGFRLLDVGCAEARLDAHLAAVEQRQIVGLEIDAGLLAASRAVPGIDAVALCQADATRMPFPDAAFDGAIVLEVLEHVPDPGAVLREVHRVLRPGGAVCVGVPTGYTERVYARLHPRYLANATHVRIYRRRELLAQLDAAGFACGPVETRNLGPALAWIVHAVLRTDADPSGHVRSHHRVGPAVDGLVERWAAHRWLGGLHRRAAARFGKSWYVYARARPPRLDDGASPDPRPIDRGAE